MIKRKLPRKLKKAYQIALKRKEPGEECHFDCVKYGLPKDSAPGHCKECPNTPPF